jgi:hypothetical protein
MIKNLNLKIIMTLHPTNKKIKIKDIIMTNLIHSVFVTNSWYKIDYISLTRRLRKLSCEKMIIYEVDPLLSNSDKKEYSLSPNFNQSSTISVKNPYYIIKYMNLSNFFNLNTLNEIFYEKKEMFNNQTIHRNTVIIFNGVPLIIIMILFKFNYFNLSGGITNRRHLLSYVHLRLAQFLTCLEGINSTTISDSFHNYDKIAIQPIFDLYKDYNTVEDLESLKIFFNTLEKWLEFKLNTPKGNFGVDLKKNEIKNNITLDYNEFFEIYNINKNNIENKKVNSN